MTTVPAVRDITVRDVSDRADLEAVVRLFGRIWLRPDGVPPVQLEVLRAIVMARSMVLGGFREGELVAGAVGFAGFVDGQPHLHSHIVGVQPDLHGQGVGAVMKWHQRDWCLARGIEHVTWTFDPLVRRNAWLNVNKLGAYGTEYHPDFYGPMPDAYNAGLPTDRCVVWWNLTSARVREAATRHPAVPDMAQVRAAGAAVVLTVDAAGDPVAHHGGGPVLLAQLPAQIPIARDPDRALRWRLAVRDVMAPALRRGLALAAVTRDGWYVLSTPTQ